MMTKFIEAKCITQWDKKNLYYQNDINTQPKNPTFSDEDKNPKGFHRHAL